MCFCNCTIYDEMTCRRSSNALLAFLLQGDSEAANVRLTTSSRGFSACNVEHLCLTSNLLMMLARTEPSLKSQIHLSLYAN